MRTTRIAAAALAIVMGVAPACAEMPAQARSVLLMQANWAPVIPLLEAAGLQVTVMEIPPDAGAGWLAAAQGLPAALNEPVVLVGHGRGGAVVSAVGSDPRVAALVYVAAQAPEAGEDGVALAARFPIGAAAGGEAGAPLPVAQTGAAAWREKPSYYAVAGSDAKMSAALQRFYAGRMKAKTIVLAAADPLASHPREIAGLILEAAGMKPSACGAAEDDGTAACAAPALPRSLAEGCRCTVDSSDPTLP